MNDTNELPKTYAAIEVEPAVYDRWETAGCFKAGTGKRDGKPSYAIAIPPPNVTGKLHMGHALNNTLQDTLIRWRRMQGYDTLWQPGCDHAGIATQSVVAKALDLAGGPSREELGREKFLEKVWEWKEEHGSAITHQLRKLGSSCDWSRERFTMDAGLSAAVRENFVKLYKAGLIYRGKRMVNWSPVLRTALSNDEVEMEEVAGHMWALAYPLTDGNGEIVVETTRPETFFADTAVAVNAADPRYQHLIGKTVTLPIVGRAIPIIVDGHADPTKGTGAVKITPAHDPNDYEVGKRHDLPMPQCIGFDGTMTDYAGPYAGQDRFECRKNLLKDLKASGVLRGETAITHAVGHCYRSHVPVEPMITEQWFVAMRTLADRALAETREGRVVFHPARWTKVYAHWLENVQDWCISRQIWWGHRIPVWYCRACGEVIVEREDPDGCTICSSDDVYQDEDVLDTWFSSALWPFSTLGWPDENDPAFKTYYPTNTLVTDRGIIYLWVARMVMMSLFNLDVKPYSDVYIHGTVLDENGTKMSKSLGNGMDPIVMIQGGEQDYLGKHYTCDGYGADALRYTLLDMTTEGQDLKLSPTRFESGRNFANKVWNAGRFLLMNLGGHDLTAVPGADDLAASHDRLGFEERWLLDRLQTTIEACTEALERYRFNDYANTAYRFFRDDLCDWYLEWAKHQFKAGGQPAADASMVIAHAFDAVLRLLHPGMPYLTEHLWQLQQGVCGGRSWGGAFLMTTPWPEAVDALRSAGAADEMGRLQDIVSTVRNIRGRQGLSDGKTLDVVIATTDAYAADRLQAHAAFLRDRGRMAALTIGVNAAKPAASVSDAVGDLAVHVSLEGAVDLADFRAKLEKDLAAKEKTAAGKRGRLANENYVTKAPPEKVQETREMLAAEEAEIAKMRETLAGLG